MRRLSQVLSAIIVAGAVAGCSVENPSAPTFTGPSEFALSVTLSATPDQLPRDGSSQSVITVLVRDAASRPVEGQRLRVSADVGTVSESEVVTGGDGRAVFAFVAPGQSTGSNAAVVRVVPISQGSQNAVVRTLTIGLGGTSTTAPTADFSFSPESPTLKATVTFDATDSKDEGITCLDLCTYSWNFGGEATGTGRIATYQFQAARTYAVTLTVTDGAGSIGTKTKNVEVSEGTKPTASIAFSPNSPGIFETVNFTGEASKVGQEGRTIVNHQWQFGDGTNATGLRVTHSYNSIEAYTVVLTVTDSAGAQGTTSQTVTVVAGVTADFTISKTTAAVDADVFFDAEASKGSHTGFGSRNPIVKYIWSFGDSTSVTETTSRIISHKYSSTGTYTINLTVEDSAGRRATKTGTTLKVE